MTKNQEKKHTRHVFLEIKRYRLGNGCLAAFRFHTKIFGHILIIEHNYTLFLKHLGHQGQNIILEFNGKMINFLIISDGHE